MAFSAFRRSFYKIFAAAVDLAANMLELYIKKSWFWYSLQALQRCPGFLHRPIQGLVCVLLEKRCDVAVWREDKVCLEEVGTLLSETQEI